MSKLYITSALIFVSIATVGAQQEASVREGMMRQAPTMMGQSSGLKAVPAVRTTEAKYAGEIKEVNSSGQVYRSMPPIDKVTTGDPKVDAKIKELITERDSKIKAIQEEYLLKIKSLIGDRKAQTSEPYGKETAKDGNSSSIQERMLKEIEMRKKLEAERLREGSSGILPTDSAAMRMKMMENNKEIKSAVERGAGAQFNSLFRGLFGGSGN